MEENNQVKVTLVDETPVEEAVEVNEDVVEKTVEPTVGAMESDVMKQSSDFIDEDDVDSFKLLGLKSKLNDLSKIVDKIKTEQNSILTGTEDDFAEYLDDIVNDSTLDELKGLTNEDIDNIFVFNDEPVALDIPFNNDEEAYRFKKDYLVMRKQSLESIAKLDEEMAAINTELSQHQEELNHLLDSFGDMEGLIRSKLVTKYEETDDEYKKQLYSKMIAAFDNALSLENVIAYAKSYKGRNIIGDYRDSKKSHTVYRHYVKVMNDLEITTDLTSFKNLEKKFLVVDDNHIYNKRPNIFIFTVIHYIASWYNKEYSKADGLFVTQFIINLKDLYYDKFVKEENKEIFINNIKTVIDIIG